MRELKITTLTGAYLIQSNDGPFCTCQIVSISDRDDTYYRDLITARRVLAVGPFILNN